MGLGGWSQEGETEIRWGELERGCSQEGEGARRVGVKRGRETEVRRG